MPQIDGIRIESYAGRSPGHPNAQSRLRCPHDRPGEQEAEAYIKKRQADGLHTARVRLEECRWDTTDKRYAERIVSRHFLKPLWLEMVEVANGDSCEQAVDPCVCRPIIGAERLRKYSESQANRGSNHKDERTSSEQFL